MRFRDLLVAICFLVVLGGSYVFYTWYWGTADWSGLLERSGLRIGSAPTPAPAPALASIAPSPTAVPTATTAPVLAPYCAPGQTPRFALGFADLKQQVGAEMGEPIECEHGNPDNGDTLQQTTTGLAVFRKADGQVSFTDGFHHWALGPGGLVTWDGDNEPEAAPNGG